MYIMSYHITFFYIEERIQYLKLIIQECQKYFHNTDIFIHSNQQFDLNMDHYYTNGKIKIIVHDLTHIHPYKLTWCCRELMKNQVNEYDVFIYGEDDILIYVETLYYWFQNYNSLIKKNYNLGFLRIEYNNPLNIVSTDLKTPFKKNDIVTFKGKKFILNTKNPYTGFWIYDKKTFKAFTLSNYYNPQKIKGYEIRESSAIGLHGKQTDFFKGTLIPLNGLGSIDNQCFVHHIPNNYLKNKESKFGKIKISDLIQN